jgi:hypothetical protein
MVSGRYHGGGMTQTKYPSDAADRFMVRMPAGLRPWIADEAKRSHRSANAQTVWMLQQMREQIEKKTTSESAGTLAEA